MDNQLPIPPVDSIYRRPDTEALRKKLVIGSGEERAYVPNSLRFTRSREIDIDWSELLQGDSGEIGSRSLMSYLHRSWGCVDGLGVDWTDWDEAAVTEEMRDKLYLKLNAVYRSNAAVTIDNQRQRYFTAKLIGLVEKVDGDDKFTVSQYGKEITPVVLAQHSSACMALCLREKTSFP